MNDVKLSIVIPYRKRLRNIQTVFASLADQTMDHTRFEVIVGVMEYAEEYVRACREVTERLNLVSVLVAGDWNTARARNIALRQASGEVAVTLDADIALPPSCLQRLYDRHFSRAQQVCLLGQSLGYDDSDTDVVEERTYSFVKQRLFELDAMETSRLDIRFGVDPVVPWALVWAGFVALPTAVLREHDLTFDETFHGWGAEDHEWGYRIHQKGIPIMLAEDVYGLHLPHLRDKAANYEAYRNNYRYFLTKWPSLDVELSPILGWKGVNENYASVQREITALLAGSGGWLGVIKGNVDGSPRLYVGALLDSESRVRDVRLLSRFDSGSAVDVLPLAGFALPYPDKSVIECSVLPPILELSRQYRDMVFAEASRVTQGLVSTGVNPG